MAEFKNFFTKINKNQSLESSKKEDSAKDWQDLVLKNKNDEDASPNFIKLENQNDIKKQVSEEDGKKIDDIIQELKKTKIRPINNQQRNLDREEGGLEQEEKENEKHIIDEWDKRFEEVEKMGENVDPNLSGAKRSMLWKLKRKRMTNKKIDKQIDNAEEDLKKLHFNQHGSTFDSRKESSLTEKIKALRQDRSDLNSNSHTR